MTITSYYYQLENWPYYNQSCSHASTVMYIISLRLKPFLTAGLKIGRSLRQVVAGRRPNLVFPVYIYIYIYIYIHIYIYIYTERERERERDSQFENWPQRGARPPSPPRAAGSAYYIVLYYIILYYIMLYYIMFYYIILYYILYIMRYILLQHQPAGRESRAITTAVVTSSTTIRTIAIIIIAIVIIVVITIITVIIVIIVVIFLLLSLYWPT